MPKRTSDQSTISVESKKLQATLREHGVARANYDAIVETINHPRATHLSDACKSMLIAMLPNGLCIPAEVRTTVQKLTVDMLGEVTQTVRGVLQVDVDAEAEKFASVAASKTSLAEAASAAARSLATSTELVKTSENTLTSAESAVVAARKKVEETKEREAMEKDKLPELEAERALVKSTLEEDFSPLRDGSAEGDTAKMHYDKVQALCVKLAVGDSLLEGLPAVFAKPPSERGSFDSMMVSQVSEAILGKLDALRKTIDEHPNAVAALASAISAATIELASANDARDSAALALDAAKASRQSNEEASDAANAAVANYQPTFQAATDVLEEKKSNLKNFVDWNVACFEMLRDRQNTATAEKKQKTDHVADAAVACQ